MRRLIDLGSSDKPVTGLAIVAGPPSPLRGAVEARLESDGFELHTLPGGPRRQITKEARLLAREFGPPSLLVTIPDHDDAAPFGDMPRERWHRLLISHLGLTVDACAAVVPDMVAAGRGTVVTISSWLALAGAPGQSYLAAASGGILAFTKSFALEVARRGVRVNGIAVGRIGHGVEPVDVAETVAFLHRDGDFFIGQVLRATGGSV